MLSDKMYRYTYFWWEGAGPDFEKEGKEGEFDQLEFQLKFQWVEGWVMAVDHVRDRPMKREILIRRCCQMGNSGSAGMGSG